MIRSANSSVVMFPVRIRIILGGKPLSVAMSKKSASKVTTVKSFCFANCQIFTSIESFRPTELTCLLSAKMSGSNRTMRYEMFWSNSNFILSKLQGAFTLRSESKAGKDILPCQFREVGKNFVIGHTCRKPPQHIVNRDTGFSHAWFSETFFGINADNSIKTAHNIHFKR